LKLLVFSLAYGDGEFFGFGLVDGALTVFEEHGAFFVAGEEE
jgi:hypothetical protein